MGKGLRHKAAVLKNLEIGLGIVRKTMTQVPFKKIKSGAGPAGISRLRESGNNFFCKTVNE